MASGNDNEDIERQDNDDREREQLMNVDNQIREIRTTNYNLYSPLFSIGVYVLNVGLDICLAYSYYILGHYQWSRLTLAFVLLPSSVMNIISLLMWLRSGINVPKWQWAFRTLSFVFMLSPIIRQIELVFFAYQSRNPKRTGVEHWWAYNHMLSEDSDCKHLMLIVTFLENAPQLVLHLYVMQRLGASDGDFLVVIQVSGVITSLVVMSWSLVAFDIALRAYLPAGDGGSLTIATKVWLFLWRLFCITGRVLALALFASWFKWYVLLFATGHVFFTFTWNIGRFSMLEGHYRDRILDVCFCIVESYAHIFCSLNVHSDKPMPKALAYHFLVHLENVALVIAWYACTVLTASDYQISAMFFVLLGFWASIVAHAEYKNCCNFDEANVPTSWHQLKMEGHDQVKVLRRMSNAEILWHPLKIKGGGQTNALRRPQDEWDVFTCDLPSLLYPTSIPSNNCNEVEVRATLKEQHQPFMTQLSILFGLEVASSNIVKLFTDEEYMQLFNEVGEKFFEEVCTHLSTIWKVAHFQLSCNNVTYAEYVELLEYLSKVYMLQVNLRLRSIKMQVEENLQNYYVTHVQQGLILEYLSKNFKYQLSSHLASVISAVDHLLSKNAVSIGQQHLILDHLSSTYALHWYVNVCSVLSEVDFHSIDTRTTDVDHQKFLELFKKVHNIREPDIELDYTTLDIPFKSVGYERVETINLNNKEAIIFPFEFDSESLHSRASGSSLRIEPMSGILQPYSPFPVDIYFTPVTTETVNYRLICHVKRERVPLACTLTLDVSATAVMTLDMSAIRDAMEKQGHDSTKLMEEEGCESTKPMEEGGCESTKLMEGGCESTKLMEEEGCESTKLMEERGCESTILKEEGGCESTKLMEGVCESTVLEEEGWCESTKPMEEGGCDSTILKAEGGCESTKPMEDGGFESTKLKAEGGCESTILKEAGGYELTKPMEEGGCELTKLKVEGGCDSTKLKEEEGCESTKPMEEGGCESTKLKVEG